MNGVCCHDGAKKEQRKAGAIPEHHRYLLSNIVKQESNANRAVFDIMIGVNDEGESNLLLKVIIHIKVFQRENLFAIGFHFHFHSSGFLNQRILSR